MFERTSNPATTREWELKKIRESAIFIGVIFKDSEEVDWEIDKAIGFNNPVFLFFFPDKKNAPATWEEFAIKRRIKSTEPKNWNELITKIKESLNEHLIGLLDEMRGKWKNMSEPPIEKV